MHTPKPRVFLRAVCIVALVGLAIWSVAGFAAAQDSPGAPSESLYLPNVASENSAENSVFIFDFSASSDSDAVWQGLQEIFQGHGTSVVRSGKDILIETGQENRSQDEMPQRVATISCVGAGCGVDAGRGNDVRHSSVVTNGVQLPQDLELIVHLDSSRTLVFRPLSSNAVDLDLIVDGEIVRQVQFTCESCTIEVTVDELFADPTATVVPTTTAIATSTAPATAAPTATPPTATVVPPADPGDEVLAIPGRIEAEDYRAGGEGVGYSDSTPGNEANTYRNDDVDIQSVQDSGGGYNVGWITTGEWLAYDVNISGGGAYRATARVAAPAGGSRFHLEIDGNQVGNSVTIPGTGGWQNWSNVAFSIDLPNGAHVLRFVAETGGFNLNYLNFAKESTAPPPTGDTTVDASVVVNAFQPEMLGVAHVNWEHAWGKPFSSQVPGLAQAYRAADIKLIRYAGGLWANSVGWERLPQRTPYTTWSPSTNNYHPDFAGQINTGASYAFHYGQNEIDDLAAFAEAAGVEVIIQVNVAANDPAMWADLVHYANVEHDYAFKYWEIGNELDHDTQLGISPEAYATRLAGYIDAMKAVDPSIEIIGGATASGHDFYRTQDYSGATTDVSRYLHEAAELTTAQNRKVDSLSYHWYQSCNNSSASDMLTYGFDGVAYNAWQHVYSRDWSQIGPERIENEVIAPNSGDMSLGITELNYDACDFDDAPQNSNYVTALWAADVIGRLAYNGLDYLTWYQGYGTQAQGYPMVYSTPNDTSVSGIVLRPIYYTFFMYGNYFGDQLVQSSTTTDPALAVYASTDSQEPGTLKLMVVNTSEAPMARSIALANFDAQSAEAYVLSNPSPTDMSNASNTGNAGTQINGVALQNMNVADSAASIAPVSVDVAGNVVDFTFAPYSVTAIIVRDPAASASN